MCVVAAITSCKKESTSVLGSSQNPQFSIENGQGDDLFAPETVGYIDTAKVVVYTLDKDKDKVPIYRPLMDGPRGFKLIDKKFNTDGMFKGVYSFYTSVGNPTKPVYVEWPDGTVDEFIEYTEQFKNYTRTTAVKINGQIFDIPISQSATFKKVIDGDKVTFIQLFYELPPR